MSSVLAIIMGGGRGSRLYPLTKVRSKPAVPLGGKYRLIDIPISNCLNSGYRSVFVLTQFQSASLNRHVARTYRFDLFAPGFVEILAAEQTDESQEWYQGTADAIRQHLHRFLDPPHDHYIILSGDHLYRMDYRDMVRRHERKKADVTVALYPVSRQAAKEYGIMRLAPDGRVVGFVEKPTDPAVLNRFRVSGKTMASRGLRDPSRPFLGSMGIYVFTRRALEEALLGTQQVDFGRHIIPGMLKSLRVMSFPFRGYWEDIGTIRAFYEANIRMTEANPPFWFYDREAPIYTRQRYLPPSQIQDCQVRDSLIAEGCSVDRAEVQGSILGIRSRVKGGTQIVRSVVMGRESYQRGSIGRNCYLERAILDLNVEIGDRVEIRGAEDRPDEECEDYSIRDGIVIVPKNAVIPSGTKI
jgi:glucose-1-phosphate adenylyltransferase